jgi:NADH pyrophosphatase NudC (nudix superfamily)
LVISCVADYVSGEVKLDPKESADFAWVSLEEAKKHELIDGIYDELVMTQAKLEGKKIEWKRFSR